MGGINIIGLISLAFGFVFGASISRTLLRSVGHNIHTSAALAQSRKSQIFLGLKKAASPLTPLARKLLLIPRIKSSIREATLILDEGGASIGEDELSGLLLALSLVSGLLGAIVMHSWVFAVALSCIVFIASIAAINNRVEKRNLAMREEIPEALRSMTTCFRSGQSLLQTMRHVAGEVNPPLNRLFAIAADRLEMGGSANEALAIMQSNSSVPELSFIAIALDVQHQSGGSIAPVLESAQDAVENDLELMRSLRVQTAQAKLSASIVTVMPFILVALFSIMSPDFLSPFFGSVLGMVLLGVAITMQLAGVLIVRRMLKVDL